MPSRATRSLAVVVCALVCSMTALLAGRTLDAVRAEDRNRDGHPDVWRSFDRHGRIARLSVDTNFDGRSDVEEFYEGGALVRRQTDRDFNDRIDLIQRFDPDTRLLVQSVTDVDADGVADLLVLFHEGQPVYRRQAACCSIDLAPVAGETGGDDRIDDDPLLPLGDPFSSDPSIRKTQVSAAPAFASSVPVGIPRHSEERSAIGTASSVVVAEVGDLPTAHAATFSTRAPPSLRLFS